MADSQAGITLTSSLKKNIQVQHTFELTHLQFDSRQARQIKAELERVPRVYQAEVKTSRLDRIVVTYVILTQAESPRSYNESTSKARIRVTEIIKRSVHWNSHACYFRDLSKNEFPDSTATGRRS